MNGQHQASGSGSTNIQIGTVSTENNTYNNCVFVKERQEGGNLNQPNSVPCADDSELIDHKIFCRRVGIRKEYTVKFVCIRAKVENISAPIQRKIGGPPNEKILTRIDVRLQATSGQKFKISLHNALPPCVPDKYVTVFFVYNTLGEEIGYMIFDDYGDELYVPSIPIRKIFLYLTMKEQIWFLSALVALIVGNAYAIYWRLWFIPYLDKFSTIGADIVMMFALFLVVNTINDVRRHQIDVRIQQIKDSIKQIYKSFSNPSAPVRT